LNICLHFYIDTSISTGTEEQHAFDIVEKIEMVSERKCDVHLIRTRFLNGKLRWGYKIEIIFAIEICDFQY
jgi:hypothetical protein